MSSSSLGVFGCIDELSRLVHRVDEVGILHGADHHQVNFATVQSLKRFFQPSTEWHPLDKDNKTPHLQHRRALGGYERLYNGIVHGLPSPVGLYALLPLAFGWGIVRTRSLLRAGTAESTQRGALLFACLFQIAFVLASSILFTFGDMSRYRYEIESLIWLVGALAIADLIARYRSAPR